MGGSGHREIAPHPENAGSTLWVIIGVVELATATYQTHTAAEPGPAPPLDRRDLQGNEQLY
jgi:hypothetical protein